MRSASKLAIVFSLVLLVLGSAGMAVAQEAEAEEEILLTGRVGENAAGQFVLIDSESGNEIVLRGSEEELAEQIGADVTVSGRWAEDENGIKYFAVSAVEPADE